VSRTLVCVAIALFLVSCEAYQPVPPGYSGPTVALSDSGTQLSGTKAQLFVAEEMDGKSIENSFSESAAASKNRGFHLTMVLTSRNLPVRSMKIKLRGDVATGAPIHAMFEQLAGSVQSVQGVVDFAPIEGATYTVKGELKDAGSSIWIEDGATHQPVTTVVVSR